MNEGVTIMKKQYTYIGSEKEFTEGGCKYKTFSSFRKMKEFAADATHDGIYYVSAPNITFKYTRDQVLSK